MGAVASRVHYQSSLNSRNLNLPAFSGIVLVMSDNDNPQGPPPSDASSEPITEPYSQPEEEFPLRVDCPQCKRPYRMEALQTRVNTLLTETQLTCPRCRRKLRHMRLKDWYDHYVQGQTPEPVHDEPTFAPKMTGIPKPPPRPPQRQAQPQPQRPSPGLLPGQRPPEGRRGGRRRRRGRRR